jgi:hypothetical protein
VPMAMQKEMMGGDRMNQRGNGWFQSIVRLKPACRRRRRRPKPRRSWRSSNRSTATSTTAAGSASCRRGRRRLAPAPCWRRSSPCCRSWSRSCS